MAAARAATIGSKVHVAGVVTAPPGVVGEAALLTVADDTAGIFVRVSNIPSGLQTGRAVELVGTLAAPYGQLEIRAVTRLSQGAVSDPPESARIDITQVGESTEASLVEIRGKVQSISSAAGRVTFEIGDGDISVRVYANAAAGVAASSVQEGDTVAATGIVGQRATGRGRLDGYRIWLRAAADLVVRTPVQPDPSGGAGTAPPRTAAPTATATSTASATATATTTATSRSTSAPSSSSAPAGELAAALQTRGASVDVNAVVTATAGLLEVDGPTIVVDDGTASVAVVLRSGAAAPAIGTEIRLVGKVGRWETGPIVRATTIDPIGAGDLPLPVQTSSAPNASLEWRLVRVSGRVERTVRAGARWRLEIPVDGGTVIVIGEPAAGALPADTNGRIATITGIVRRSTSDSTQFQLLPRNPDDLRLGPAPAARTPGLSPAASSAAGPSQTTHTAVAPGGSAASSAAPVPLSELPTHTGARVTVAGIVIETGGGEATIEDGTGSVRIGGDAAAPQIALLEQGDAVEIAGIVSVDDMGPLLVADPESVIVLPALTRSSGAPEYASSGLADGSGLGLNPGLNGSGAPIVSESDASHRTSSAVEPAGIATMLAVVLLAGVVVLACAGVLVARRAGLDRTGSNGVHSDE